MKALYFLAISSTMIEFVKSIESTTLNRIKDDVHRMIIANDLGLGDSDGVLLDKALTQADMGLISDYGCWCFFETSHGKGRGRPIDDIDAMCKTLHDGYECIMDDAQNEGIDNCIPWEITYNSAFGGGLPGGMSQETLITECDNVNGGPDTCASRTCKVEGWFVQQYFLWSLSGGQIDESNRHDNGFDQSVECPISTGLKSEKACCGFYPIRFPFKTYDGSRDCCQMKTFNTNLYQCCDDGRVKMSC